MKTHTIYNFLSFVFFFFETGSHLLCRPGLVLNSERPTSLGLLWNEIKGMCQHISAFTFIFQKTQDKMLCTGSVINVQKKCQIGGLDMAHCISKYRALTDIAELVHLLAPTFQLTTMYNSNSKEFRALFWTSAISGICTQYTSTPITYTRQTFAYTDKNKPF